MKENIEKINKILNQEKPILYVDMDEVMCNFKQRFWLIKKLFPNIKYPQSQYGFFSRLNPIEDAIKSIKLLEDKYDIWFLTRPSFPNIHCYSEKAEWILEHLGYQYQQKLIIMPNKSMAIGHHLIDDSTSDGQTEFIGEHIHFGTKDFPNWNAVTKHLL